MIIMAATYPNIGRCQALVFVFVKLMLHAVCGDIDAAGVGNTVTSGSSATTSTATSASHGAGGSSDIIIDHVLEPNQVGQLTVNSSQTLHFTVHQLTDPDTSYVVFQVHTQWRQLMVSLDATFSVGNTTQGSDAGILVLLGIDQESAGCWVKLVLQKPQIASVKILALATTGTETDPIPGGCSEEFPLELDPNIHIVPAPFISSVRFQYAHTALQRGGRPDRCELSQYAKAIEYHVFQIFLHERDHSEDLYLEKMQGLLTMQPKYFDLSETKLATITYVNGKTVVDFAAYAGQGVIYVVIARQTTATGVTYASYLPTATYSCTWRAGHCQATGSAAGKVMAVVLGIAGLLWCFAGHRYFQFAMFMAGYLALLIGLLMLLISVTNWDSTAVILSSSGLALFGGAAWWALWFFQGVPVISVLLPGLLLGFVVVSLLFVYTPLGLLMVWHSSFNFGMVFASGLLFPAVLLLMFTKVLSLFACAVVGSYITVFAVDVFVQGSVRLILMNTVLKAAQPSYLLAVTTVPFQSSDVALCVIWLALAVSGFVIQWWRERGRPHFPACPWEVYKASRVSQRLDSVGQEHASTQDIDERSPLLESAHRTVVDPI